MAGVAGGDVLRGPGHRVCRGGPRPGQGAASSAAPSQETVLRGGARGGAATAVGGAAAVPLRPQLAHQDPVLRPARPRCLRGAHHRAAAQSERRARVSSGRVGRGQGRAGPGGGARVRRGGPGQGAAGAVPPRLQHAGTAAYHYHCAVGHQ